MSRYGRPSTAKNILGALLLAATAWLYAVKVSPTHAAEGEPVASEAETAAACPQHDSAPEAASDPGPVSTTSVGPLTFA